MTNWYYDGFGGRRRRTRTVHVGDVALGSEHPIRVQSMTTPSTQDTEATVAQTIRLVEAGCEIVRLTVPTARDADNLPNIRRELERRGVKVPLVADIHFTPAAAMKAVEHVDKIRVNPGNYADKKKFNVREYDDSQYAEELERIEKVFSPLVKRAKELGVSMRIGTNHGSLSDRIMNRYGDTPEGMVESALEFVRICEAYDYRELVLSMKSSNPMVVQHVYRLLAERMAAEKMDYPFHLGVTEAGDGEDGRVKSAIGIGALLDEGLGDTVRVSLTEDPVHEIPVALALVERHNRAQDPAVSANAETVPNLRRFVEEVRDPHRYERRPSRTLQVGPHPVGGGNPVLVEVPLDHSLADGKALRASLDMQVGVRVPEETRAEIVSIDVGPDDLEAAHGLRESLLIVAPRVALSARVPFHQIGGDPEPWLRAAHRLHVVATSPFDRDRWVALVEAALAAGVALVLEADGGGEMEPAVDLAQDAATWARGAGHEVPMLTLTPSARFTPLHGMRLLSARLASDRIDAPLLLLDDPLARGLDARLGASAALGGLLCDGIGDAIQIRGLEAGDSRQLAFTILQGARVRITKTEFISCPSCGRTLFDLEETTARIKSRTSHLKGVKIAVMGCIVNGPGEMADADFGYVGWGEDKIALFVGKEMVERDIPTAGADERLVELIREHGKWIDPPVTVSSPS